MFNAIIVAIVFFGLVYAATLFGLVSTV